MSNMSYCRFQNTLMDLEVCVKQLNERSTGIIDTVLSAEEEKAKDRLIKLCEQIACDFGDLSPERR